MQTIGDAITTSPSASSQFSLDNNAESKENFHLKLRIYYLERELKEKTGQIETSSDHVELFKFHQERHKKVEDLKTQLQEKVKDLEDRDNLLVATKKAIEKAHTQLQKEKMLRRQDNDMFQKKLEEQTMLTETEKEQLRKENMALRKKLQNCEAKVKIISQQNSNFERSCIVFEQEKAALKSELLAFREKSQLMTEIESKVEEQELALESFSRLEADLSAATYELKQRDKLITDLRNNLNDISYSNSLSKALIQVDTASSHNLLKASKPDDCKLSTSGKDWSIELLLEIWQDVIIKFLSKLICSLLSNNKISKEEVSMLFKEVPKTPKKLLVYFDTISSLLFEQNIIDQFKEMILDKLTVLEEFNKKILTLEDIQKNLKQRIVTIMTHPHSNVKDRKDPSVLSAILKLDKMTETINTEQKENVFDNECNLLKLKTENEELRLRTSELNTKLEKYIQFEKRLKTVEKTLASNNLKYQNKIEEKNEYIKKLQKKYCIKNYDFIEKLREQEVKKINLKDNFNKFAYKMSVNQEQFASAMIGCASLLEKSDKMLKYLYKILKQYDGTHEMHHMEREFAYLKTLIERNDLLAKTLKDVGYNMKYLYELFNKDIERIYYEKRQDIYKSENYSDLEAIHSQMLKDISQLDERLNSFCD